MRRDYLKCQKDTISTTTLIAAGLGVTVGILALVGLCVWLCNRKKRRHPRTSTDNESQPGKSDNTRTSIESYDEEVAYTSTRQKSQDEKRRVRPHNDESSPEREKMSPGKINEKSSPAQVRRDPRAARVESSSSAEYAVTPPPPHPAHVPKTQLPSEILGSPVDDTPSRQLYPSNPSPMPRHLRPQPGVRASNYSRRQSVASARIADEDVSIAPPLPLPVRSNTGTPPLTIRKSTIGSSPSRGHVAGIPSYYEATQGQASTATHAARPALSMYGRAESAPDAAPPVPLSVRPMMDARRPSAPALQTQKRPSEAPGRDSAGRGGMI